MALLIDLDNISLPKRIDGILGELEADWQTDIRRSFENESNHKKFDFARYGITRIGVPRLTKKNSTDIALAIDAVNLSFTESVQGFAIASSDTDFKHLSTYLKNRGFFVHLFVEDKLKGDVMGWKAACNRLTILGAPPQKPIDKPAPKSLIPAPAKLKTQKAPPKASTATVVILDAKVREERLSKCHSVVHHFLSSRGGPAKMADVADALKKGVQGFSILELGFVTLINLLQHLGFNLSELKADKDWPVWMVSESATGEKKPADWQQAPMAAADEPAEPVKQSAVPSHAEMQPGSAAEQQWNLAQASLHAKFPEMDAVGLGTATGLVLRVKDVMSELTADNKSVPLDSLDPTLKGKIPGYQLKLTGFSEYRDLLAYLNFQVKG